MSAENRSASCVDGSVAWEKLSSVMSSQAFKHLSASSPTGKVSVRVVVPVHLVFLQKTDFYGLGLVFHGLHSYSWLSVFV